MERTGRFYKIQNLLQAHQAPSKQFFLEQLKISEATFKRDLEYLRDRLGMPIVYDRKAGGYRLDDSDPAAKTFELPGLWFSATEIHAMLTLEHLVTQLQPGLLAQQLGPLRARIRNILGGGDRSPEQMANRIRILPTGARDVEPRHFQTIATALLHRRRLQITHDKRQTDETLVRTVSPQRLVHYRGNWYLDSYCHLRRGLRTFSMDAIAAAEITGKAAREIDGKRLDAVLASGYGVFGGARIETAVLQFNAERARWVSREHWHHEQEGDFQLDGSYILKVPYADPRELLMDILKYGADVEVLAPDSLRELVKAECESAANRYR